VTSDSNTDRFLIALGGFAGFLLTFISALRMGGDDISAVLLRASVGMIAGAILMKLLLMLAHSSFRDALRARNAAQPPPPETAPAPNAGAKTTEPPQTQGASRVHAPTPNPSQPRHKPDRI
jgi:hypothetical protein